jgi:hypothetical protein
MTRRNLSKTLNSRTKVTRDYLIEETCVALTYVVGPDKVHNIAYGDFEEDIITESVSGKPQANAYWRWLIPVNPSQLPKGGGMPDYSLIVFPPGVRSQERALKILRRLIKTIEADGLVVGMHEDGELMWDPDNGDE